MPLSYGSTMSVSFSTPTMSTCSVVPARTMSSASASAWQNPAHAAEMSKAAARVAPSRCATIAAADGVCHRCVTVAMITQPSWSAVTPAFARAFSAAVVDMSMTVSSAAAACRVTIPERSRIHSSEESMFSMTSSLVTTRAGR